MAPKRRGAPPIRPNADGTGFERISGESRRLAPAPSGSCSSREEKLASSRQNRGRGGSDRSGGEVSIRKGGSSGALIASQESSLPPEMTAITNNGSKNEDPFSCPSNQRVPQDPTSISCRPQTLLICNLSTDTFVLDNECHLHASALRNLGASSGALLCVELAAGGGKRMFLEAVMRCNVPKETIVLGEAMATAFGVERRVGVRLAEGGESIPWLSRIIIDIQLDLSSGKVMVPSASSALYWRSQFRRAFHHRVICSGMRAHLPTAAFRALVEVQAITTDDECSCSLYGILTDATIVEVAFFNALQSEPSIYTTYESSGTMCLEHQLFVGDPGTGKTYRLEMEAENDRRLRHYSVHYLRVEELPPGEDAELTTATVLREAFRRARNSTPCTVVLDDLHLLCGISSSSTGSQWAMMIVASALREELRELREQRIPLRVLASAPSVESLHPSLTTTDALGLAVVRILPPATAQERYACLAQCILDATQESDVSEEVLLEVAANTHGFIQRDLRRMVEAAVISSVQLRCSTRITDNDLRAAARSVHPSSLKQFDVFLPDVSWADIGGSDEAKRVLQDVVAWCLGKQQWVFKEFNLAPPKGVLLYGPPGCSKTMLAKALANESKMNFISIKGPEVFSKWVGDSEKAVREIFNRARASAPCVVFIDELDGMCGHRGRGGVSDRVISQFLTELDGMPAAFDDRSNALVFVAATNRPDNIDAAVLRPGRIDRRVYVGLPRLEEREAIVAIQFKCMPVEPGLSPCYVAERTEGYTGAEVVAVVKEAAFGAITVNTAAPYITLKDIDEALRKVRPRIKAADLAWYTQWALGQSKIRREA